MKLFEGEEVSLPLVFKNEGEHEVETVRLKVEFRNAQGGLLL